MFKVKSGIDTVEYKCFKFSGGEVQVNLDANKIGSSVSINAQIESADQIMELVLIVAAIKEISSTIQMYLTLPYLPYARQDRVMNKGEALAIKAFAGIINSLGFERVTVLDAHSDVSLAVINNVENVEQYQFVQRIPLKLADCVLVSPDAGALKKTFKTAQSLGLEMVTAMKHRDTTNGHITNTEVFSKHIGDKNFLIVDDICDGGRTFIELAKVLRPFTNGKIYLYVTNFIGKDGLTPLQDSHIDHIYAANIFSSVSMSSFLTKINMNYDPSHN